MFYVVLTTVIAIANMVYAAVIYLSLHGWLVSQDPSGLQLLLHIFITAPVTLVTTACLLFLAVKKHCSDKLWKLNLAGLLVPLMGIQTGVTYYHYDKFGLAISVFVALGLLVLFCLEIRTYSSRPN